MQMQQATAQARALRDALAPLSPARLPKHGKARAREVVGSLSLARARAFILWLLVLGAFAGCPLRLKSWKKVEMPKRTQCTHPSSLDWEKKNDHYPSNGQFAITGKHVINLKEPEYFNTQVHFMPNLPC